MSNALPIRLADAVAAQINTAVAAESFSTNGFTVARSYFDWDEKYTDLSTMQVDVVFTTTQPDGSVGLKSAGFIEYQSTVDIVVRKRFAPSDRTSGTGRLKNASVDAMVTLVDELHRLFVDNRNTVPLDSEVEASWSGSNVMTWANQAMLRQGLFEGVVRVKFDITEAA